MQLSAAPRQNRTICIENGDFVFNRSTFPAAVCWCRTFLILLLLWEESPLVLLALGEEKATEKMYLRNWEEDQSNSS